MKTAYIYCAYKGSEYTRYMHNPLWFTSKRYGYGWMPCTWQGWLLTALFLLVILLDALRMTAIAQNDTEAVLLLIPDLIVLIPTFTLICWLTGKKPHWRWGGK